MRAPLIMSVFLEPEVFAVRWGREETPTLSIWLMLGGSAALGVGAWSAMLHAWRGGGESVLAGFRAVIASGIGWTAAIPCLVVLGGLLGSRLPLRAPVLASLVAVSFGGLALLCAVPILWFFEITSGGEAWARGIAVTSTGLGVGLCVVDVFRRVMGALERRSFFHLVWVGLLGATCVEMFVLFDLLRFT